MAEEGGAAAKAVGPYLLQRILGKGQTGRVVWDIVYVLGSG